MLRHRPARPNARTQLPNTTSPIARDAAALFGGALLPPALLNELWLSVGATGQHELLLRTADDARGWTVVSGLTVVVADLGAASARYAAQLGCAPLALDPAEMEEAGMAQRFALVPCWLTLLTPADDTAAADFLAGHGPGLYALTLRDGVVRGSRVGK